MGAIGGSLPAGLPDAIEGTDAVREPSSGAAADTGPAAPTPSPAPSAALGASGRMAALSRVAAHEPPPDPADVEADVDRLFEAMDGAGTDEAAIFAVLEHRGPAHREAVEQRFAEKHGDEAWPTLSAALHDELSWGELERAQKALGKDRGGFLQRDEILRDARAGKDPGGAIRHMVTWFTFGVGGKTDAEDGLPRVRGQEVRERMLPNLKPGDTILCGNNGGVSHALVYVGDGKVIHSMATEETMRGNAGRVLDTLVAPFEMAAEAAGLKERKQGVIVEDVAAFFDRFERDSYVVMRSPALTPEKAEAGIERIRGLVGKEYDWDFAPGNDAFYCTEVVGEFFRAALGDEAPRTGGTAQNHPFLHREAVIDPLDVMRSPDLVPVLHNQNLLAEHQKELEGRQ